MTTPLNPNDHLVNPELIKHARHLIRRNPALQKAAFVPGGDAMAGGGAPPGGAGAPPMDPAMAGMDPAMMGGDPAMMGGDPSMAMGGGGAPAPPPPSGGGGGGDPALTAKLDQILQAIQGGGIGAQSGGNMAGQLKPKIDVNVALMQISKMLARIADSLGIQIPASEMIATPNDLTQMATKQQAGGQQDAAMGGGAPGGIGGIPPMPGMEAGPGASTGGKAAADKARLQGGRGYDAHGLEETMNKAAAIIKLRGSRRKAG